MYGKGRAMTRASIAEELESAADRIADMSRADLQIILRRAALMLALPNRRWRARSIRAHPHLCAQSRRGSFDRGCRPLRRSRSTNSYHRRVSNQLVREFVDRNEIGLRRLVDVVGKPLIQEVYSVCAHWSIICARILGSVCWRDRERKANGRKISPNRSTVDSPHRADRACRRLGTHA